MKINTLRIPSWLTVATYLLLASIATFSFKKPTFFWQNTNLNDLLLLVSFLCLLVALYKKQIAVKINKKVIIGFTVGFVSIVVGTCMSIFLSHALPSGILREYARIFADIVILFEIYVIGLHDRTFIRNALMTLVFSTLLLPFIMYSPYLSFFLDESMNRFTGFLYDPNYYATLQIVPTFILLWIIVERPYKKILILIISLVLFSLSIGTILWSGSRGGIAGFIIAILTMGVLMVWKKLPYKKILYCFGIILMGLLMIYVILPKTARVNIASRTGLFIIPADSIATDTNTHTILPQIKIAAKQDREVLWANAFKQIIRNPIGYGADYNELADIVDSHADHHRVVHNTLLQIILTGGFVLLIVIGVGIYVFGKSIMVSKIPFNEVHYLLASLIGIFTAGLFLDSLWSRWMWIMIGLIVVLLKEYPKET